MISRHRRNSGKRRLMQSLAAAGAFILVLQQVAWAANGTWSEPTGDGTWSNAANWSGGTIGEGVDATADFSQINLDAQAVYNVFGNDGVGNPLARNAVNLDTPRTIGSLTFGDTNLASPGAFEVYSLNYATNLLTLAGTAPTITVNALTPINTSALVGATPVTPENLDDAIVRTTLVGTSGFTKAGTGILTLSGPNPNLTGNININQGTLRLRTGATFDFETVTNAAVTRFVIANGATLESQVSIGQNAALPAAAGVTVPAGATATIRNIAAGSTFFSNITGGAGSTLNYISTTGGVLTGTIDRDWNGFANVNFSGTAATQSQVRLRNNGGTFNANSFLNTTVNLDNVILFTNTNSGGNTNFIGALSGTSTGTLQGGAAGTVATYQIGNLNTNTTFAGTVVTGAGGININKVGSGTLELSGTLSYQPRVDVTLNRRGGVTSIQGGTLKLTGPAAILGGIIDTVGFPAAVPPVPPLGELWATVDIRAGATLDVAGTATAYSTASLQQVIGRGTVVGNYNHDEGILAPGDSVTGGNTASLIAAGGTLNFSNTLSFAGTGQINFDISPSLVSGNDLLQVGGANLAGSPVLKVGFLGGATAGQYTIVNSATPLAGTTAGWTVQWEGRGAAPSLVQTANQVKLDLGTISSGNLNWRGDVSGVWNAGAATGTANWQNTATAAGDKFFQLDNVAFRDTYDGVNAPTTTTITLNTTVSPTSVTVNSSLNYTISGTGRITGGSSLTKEGSGLLTLTTANDFSGGTTISGGKLALGAAGALGSGSITISNAELHAGVNGNFELPNALVLGGASSVVSNDNNTSQTLNVRGNITGSGTLNLQNNSVGDTTLMTPPVRNGVDLFGDNTGFHGTIAMSGPTSISLRIRSLASAGTDIAYDLGNNVDAQLSTVIGVNSTVPLGSLSGGVNPRISGHTSGGGAGTTIYQIGGLGTSTTFDGLIENGNTTTSPDNFTAITKVGGGTLSLTFANTYTGNTTVQGGALNIAVPYLADAADVFIANSAKLGLDFVGDDTIDSLYLNGVPQAPGFYGLSALGSTFFTGTGRLNVLTMGAALGFTGDYNGDGKVDAADYTVWRDNLGGPGTALQHRDPLNGAGVVSTADYASWKANFGMGPGSGGGSLTSVPEPTSAMLVMMALGMVAGSASRRRS